MELFCEKFSLPVVNDLVKGILGKELGRGVYRTVYECALARDHVLKIANTDLSPNFANAIEWQVWMRVQCTTWKSWFAPAVDITDGGLVLVQKRTTPVTVEDLKREIPRVPTFFTDLKSGNWGRLNGRIVCHDYGENLLMEVGMTKRTRKADWWE